jgi:hypothetical protein
MILHINDTIKLSEIQEHFTKCFPALCINFYKKRIRNNATTPGDLIDPNTFVAEVRTLHYNGDLQIFSFNSVSYVEKEFRQKFGLYIKIMRKELSGWEETTNTDRFTLSQQMEMSSFSLNESAPLHKAQLLADQDL